MANEKFCANCKESIEQMDLFEDSELCCSSDMFKHPNYKFDVVVPCKDARQVCRGIYFR